MKKLLVAGMISAAVATSAMAAGKHTFGQAGDVLNLQVKQVDVKDLGSGTVYGVNYHFNRDLGQKGAWGLVIGFEFNYGSLDNDNDDDTTDYTEASLMFAPSYTFNNNIKLYFGAKGGSTDLGDNTSNDNSSGDHGTMITGVIGVQYSYSHLAIGFQAESGTISLPETSYNTTSYTATLGYKF